MGRDGVAYTFATTEEGHQLTRIEQRINRELIRDEIDGLDLVSDRTAPQAPEGGPAPPPPPTSLMKRPRKRYRRGL